MSDKIFSKEDLITWTDWLGEMGWYKEKDGRWYHDDETGYFESTEKLFEHYHPEMCNGCGNYKEQCKCLENSRNNFFNELK